MQKQPTIPERRWATLLAKSVGQGLDDLEDMRKTAGRYRHVSRYHVSLMVDTFLKGECEVNDVVGICSHWLEPRLCRRRLQYQKRKYKPLLCSFCNFAIEVDESALVRYSAIGREQKVAIFYFHQVCIEQEEKEANVREQRFKQHCKENPDPGLSCCRSHKKD